MATNPPFNERRIAYARSSVRRDPSFWRNTSGRRLAVYLFGLAALLIVQIRGLSDPAPLDRRAAAPQEAPGESRPTSAPAPVVDILHPPQQFIADRVRHELLAVPDEGEDFAEFGATAILRYLQGREDVDVEAAPDSRPVPGAAVDLVNAEALAAPERFRGGYVRSKGKLVRMLTIGFKPGVVPADLLYQGFMVGDPQSPDGGLMFLTTARPPEYDRAEDTLEVEGVFLQNFRYEALKGNIRRVPCIVATSIRVLPRQTGGGMAMGVSGTGVIVVVVVGALALIIRSLMSREASPDRSRQLPPRRTPTGTGAP